jgi:fructosamine-3-kinase
VIPHAYLLIEYLPGHCLDRLELDAEARADIETQLADVLAELHGHRGDRWGGIDVAGAPDTWADLFGPRLAAAREHPGVSERLEPRVLAAVDRAIEAAPALLADAGSPTLVHGDVWDGNTIVRHDGSRWRLVGLLDPDLQFADVEYELAYLEVFDVPRDGFFAAYRRHRKLRAGYEQRRQVYWLYTALVHVALFGDRFFRDFTASTAAAIDRLHAS